MATGDVSVRWADERAEWRTEEMERCAEVADDWWEGRDGAEMVIVRREVVDGDGGRDVRCGRRARSG